MSTFDAVFHFFKQTTEYNSLFFQIIRPSKYCRHSTVIVSLFDINDQIEKIKLSALL